SGRARSRASAWLTPSTRRTPTRPAGTNAIFRDDGRSRPLSRRLDRQHEGGALPLGKLGSPGGPDEDALGALRRQQRLDADRGPRRQEPAEAQRAAKTLHAGGKKISGLAAR